MALAKIATVAELTPGKGKQVTFAGKTIAVFHDGTKIFAIDGICPHRGAPLAEGMCREGQVMCPWHSARFDLTTGAHLCPPAQTGVKAYPVQVIGDEVKIDL